MSLIIKINGYLIKIKIICTNYLKRFKLYLIIIWIIIKIKAIKITKVKIIKIITNKITIKEIKGIEKKKIIIIVKVIN